LIDVTMLFTYADMARLKEMAISIWYEPADPSPKFQCPCCDYVTLAERSSFLICFVCFWEDDGADVDHLERGGPNGVSLGDARKNFINFGACEISMLPHVCPTPEREAFEYRPRAIK